MVDEYRAFCTDVKEESDLGYLWDTNIYLRRNQGAGYKKFKIISIAHLPDDVQDFERKIKQKGGIPTVTIELRGAHWREKSKNIYQTMGIDYDYTKGKFKLVPEKRYMFTSAVDYFVEMEKTKILAFKAIKNSKQYKYELNEIKAKYPEYFL
jgi:hypothetical protein